MKGRLGEHDTICAISTPPGNAGIGVIRISGKAAIPISGALFRGKGTLSEFDSHTLHHGKVIDPETQTLVDEAIFLIMKAPNSYTGENTVEIQSHGNNFLLEKIIALLLKQGARLAAPGEFTRRAFLSGKIDLAQAEAVMELIASQSETHHQWAMAQMKGQLSKKILSLQGRLLPMIAQIEASIDFSEDEIPLCSPETLSKQISAVLQSVSAMLADYSYGRQIREGYTVVIVGRPNVGKSSLLNLFLKEDRAIVTPYPGTTRDLLQETIDFGGILIKLVDTAGYREAEHPIEQEGVRRGEAAQKNADLTLWLLDASEALSKEDIKLSETLKNGPKIIVLNKSDLPRALEMDSIPGDPPEEQFLNLSARTSQGFPELRDKIKAQLITRSEKEPPAIGLLRHKKALESAKKSLVHALASVNQGLSWEFPAIDLRESLDALGEITGETTVDEILDQIFDQFCIGK